MRFLPTLIATLSIPLFLSGCFSSGSGSQSAIYDGSWTVSYTNPADVPVAGANQTVVCTKPGASLDLFNGAGSTIQTQACVINTYDATTGALISSTNPTLDYYISVTISDAGAVNALVNGAPLAGTCISTSGCSAQSGTTIFLSITR